MTTCCTYPMEIEARIARVQANLKPPAQLNSSTITMTLAERMKQVDVPGVSVAVINEGQVEWARGFGSAEIGIGIPVTPDTLFQAASISKPVTSLITLRLVAEGVLDLDEDVNRYLKSWKVPANGDWQPRITLRLLMSHGAGTTIHGFPGYPRDRALPGLLQILSGAYPANTRPVLVTALPGTQFRYSGGGTLVMQQLLQDVIGMQFPRLAMEMVLSPLGMEHSTFEQPLPDALQGKEAAGHGSCGEIIAGKWHVYPEMAAAGLWTTPSDLCRLIISVQQARAGRPHPFLSREVVDTALAPQNDGLYGLGFRLEGTGSHLKFGHTGSNAGFRSYFVGYADHGLGACMMTNGDNGADICTELRSSIGAEYGWAGFLPSMAGDRKDVDHLLHYYAGVYDLKPGISLRVEAAGSHLLVTMCGQEPVAFVPDSETTFRSAVVNTVLKFEWTSEHRVAAAHLLQNGDELTANRRE